VSIKSLRDAGETLYFGLDRDGFEDVVERFEIHRDLHDPLRTSSIERGSQEQKRSRFFPFALSAWASPMIALCSAGESF
jgi:hypothetical protein